MPGIEDKVVETEKEVEKEVEETEKEVEDEQSDDDFLKKLLEEEAKEEELSKEEEQRRKNKDAEEARKRREAEAKAKAEAEAKAAEEAKAKEEAEAKAKEEEAQKLKAEEEAKAKEEAESKAKEESKKSATAKLGEQLASFKEKYPDVDLASLDKDEFFMNWVRPQLLGGKSFTELYEGYNKGLAEKTGQKVEDIVKNHIKAKGPGSSKSSGIGGNDVYSEQELQRIAANMPKMKPEEYAKIKEKYRRSIAYYDKK